MLLAHDCTSKPSIQPSWVFHLGEVALCHAEDALYCFYGKSLDDYLKILT